VREHNRTRNRIRATFVRSHKLSERDFVTCLRRQDELSLARSLSQVNNHAF
jgi:hypothetical protein